MWSYIPNQTDKDNEIIAQRLQFKVIMSPPNFITFCKLSLLLTRQNCYTIQGNGWNISEFDTTSKIMFGVSNLMTDVKFTNNAVAFLKI